MGQALSAPQEIPGRSKDNPEPDPSIRAKARNGDSYGVYPLYAPKRKKPKLDILFFHGLQTKDRLANAAWWHTWLSEAGSNPRICWPKEWLSATFDSANIWSVNYDARLKVDHNYDVTHWGTIAEMVLQMLIGPAVNIGGDGRQVVLVGHSLGGLILKQVVMEALVKANGSDDSKEKHRAKAFFDNIKKIVYYSTPHAGSLLEEWSRNPIVDNVIFQGIAGGGVDRNLTAWLEVFNTSSSALQTKFANVKSNLTPLCFAERMKTNLPVLGMQLVVKDGSAHLSNGINKFYNADHYGICQPVDENDERISNLIDYIQDAYD
ncbi:hypothetical protein VaNZ11_007828, partial [Volvox africanus]